MTERATELSSLKQEVAELWSRYRKDEPAPDTGGERLALVEQARGLDVKQRALVSRRAVLQSAVDAERRRVSAFEPVLRACGAVVGLGVTALVAVGVLPAVADWSLSLTAVQGALAVALSTLSLPFLLGSR